MIIIIIIIIILIIVVSFVHPQQYFVALMLVPGLSKCLKQIIQIKLNRVTNPNWQEANQLQAWSRI